LPIPTPVSGNPDVHFAQKNLKKTLPRYLETVLGRFLGLGCVNRLLRLCWNLWFCDTRSSFWYSKDSPHSKNL